MTLTALATTPLLWTLVCEIFFFAYLLRDNGMSFQPARMIRLIWPMMRVLIVAVLGAAFGWALLSLISPAAGWVGLFLGALPACVMADRLLRRLRPHSGTPWRWAAGVVIAAQSSVSLLAFST